MPHRYPPVRGAHPLPPLLLWPPMPPSLLPPNRKLSRLALVCRRSWRWRAAEAGAGEAGKAVCRWGRDARAPARAAAWHRAPGRRRAEVLQVWVSTGRLWDGESL